MLNGNNPAAYADPTGFYTQPMFEDSSNVGLENEEGDVGAVGSISSDIANVSALSGIGGDAQNGTYKSEDDAAMAVALRYTKTAYSSGKEAGALIYCTNGAKSCGYGPLIPGHKFSVNLTNVDFESLPKNATVVGFWHAHHDGDTTEDLSGHMEEAWRIVNSHFASAPFTIYTSLGKDLVSQILNSKINPMDNPMYDSIDPNYICRGCLP